MEELNKKTKGRIMGRLQKALDDEDKTLVFITDNSVTVKGNLIEAITSITKVLDDIRQRGAMEAIAVRAAINALKDTEPEIKPDEKTIKDLINKLFD